MIRISKLTDYAMLILAYMGQKPTQVLQTTEIAAHTHLAKPTVAKILKQLVIKNILISTRGANGGYKLVGNIEDISMANIITALEGEVAITQCNSQFTTCKQAEHCPINLPWQQINRIIYDSLDAYKLSDLVAAAVTTKSCGNANAGAAQ